MFRVQFDNAKFYKTDNGYDLYGRFITFQGIIKAFNSSTNIEPSVCLLPIYRDTYQLWEKQDDGKKKPVDKKPSVFEQALCKHLDRHLDTLIPSGYGVKGYINFCPDFQLTLVTPENINSVIESNFKINAIEADSTIPEYAPKATSSNSRKSGRGYTLTPQEKRDFLLEEIKQSLFVPPTKEDSSLSELVTQLIREHQGDEAYLSIYFNLLGGCLK